MNDTNSTSPITTTTTQINPTITSSNLPPHIEKFNKSLNNLLNANNTLLMELKTQQTLSTKTMDAFIATVKQLDLASLPSTFADIEKNLQQHLFSLSSAELTATRKEKEVSETGIIKSNNLFIFIY